MADSTASGGPKQSRDLLEEMAKGFFRGKVLCAAVQLGLPDAFVDGEHSVDEWLPRLEHTGRRCTACCERWRASA